MKNFTLHLFISALVAMVGLNSFSQTVFLETFDEGDGSVTGTDDVGGVSWSATCPTCVGGDWFEIISEQMEGLDTNGPADWETTADIDISSCDKFEITFDLSEEGTMEACGDGCNATDWVMLEYNIDGTGWQTPTNATFCAGACADVDVIQSDDIPSGSLAYSSGCIPGGDDLRIRITVQCWSGSEFWRFDNVQVSCSDYPNVNAGMDTTVCEGESVTLTADNPDGADISWDGGVTDGVAFTPSLGTTTYTVTAEDPVGGCISTDEVDVTVIAPPTASVDPAGPFTTASSSEIMSGSPAGGTWSASCGGCIDPSTGEFDPSAAGAGIHTICYDVGVDPCDDQDCIDIEVTGSGPCPWTYDVILSEPTCYGFSDGSVTVDVTGGEPPYIFTIQDSSESDVNIDNSNTANNLGEGWYTFTVVDDNDCIIEGAVFLEEPEELEVDLILTDPLCHGDETGIAVADTVINYQGSYSDVSYLWSVDSEIDNDTITGLGAGIYTLTVNDSAGCSIVEDFEITEPPELIFSEIGYDPAYCRLYDYQSGNGVVYAAAAGGQPDYTYEWTYLEDSTFTNNTTWGGLNPGDYEIVVTDDNGCILEQIITVDSLNPIADFDVISDQLNDDCEGTAVVEVVFDNNSLNYANPNNPGADPTFWWNLDEPEAPWFISKSINDTIDTSYTLGGEYNVCLRVQNKNGCTDELCKLITVYDPLEFEPINVFTPNGDGVNDQFDFSNKAVAVSEFSCTIVNRWGTEIFKFTHIDDAWDGTAPGGNKCPDGVYFYTYEGTADNGDPFSGQGTVHLVSGE